VPTATITAGAPPRPGATTTMPHAIMPKHRPTPPAATPLPSPTKPSRNTRSRVGCASGVSWCSVLCGRDRPAAVSMPDAECSQPGEVDRGGQPPPVLGDPDQARHPGAPPAVAAAEQVRQLAFHLRSGGAVVRPPAGSCCRRRARVSRASWAWMLIVRPEGLVVHCDASGRQRRRGRSGPARPWGVRSRLVTLPAHTRGSARRGGHGGVAEECPACSSIRDAPTLRAPRAQAAVWAVAIVVLDIGP
jgi:hypothetical protein